MNLDHLCQICKTIFSMSFLEKRRERSGRVRAEYRPTGRLAIGQIPEEDRSYEVLEHPLFLVHRGFIAACSNTA
jgi:hypothetical protein